MVRTRVTVAEVTRAVADVPDPEVPVVTIEDLGILPVEFVDVQPEAWREDILGDDEAPATLDAAAQRDGRSADEEAAR